MINVYSHKKRFPVLPLILIIIITLIICTSSFIIYKKLSEPINNEKNSPNKLDINESEKVASFPIESEKEIIFTNNTDFHLTTTYSCNHKITTISKIPNDFINKKIDEIKIIYPEYEIINYNEFEISANHYVPQICGNHYMIVLSGNEIISYNKNSPEKIEKKIKINMNEFLKEDIEILKGGIEVGSKSEMLEFLEGFMV